MKWFFRFEIRSVNSSLLPLQYTKYVSIRAVNALWPKSLPARSVAAPGYEQVEGQARAYESESRAAYQIALFRRLGIYVAPENFTIPLLQGRARNNHRRSIQARSDMVRIVLARIPPLPTLSKLVLCHLGNARAARHIILGTRGDVDAGKVSSGANPFLAADPFCGCADESQPWESVGIGERSAVGHFLDIGFRVERVAVDEGDGERFREGEGDGGLSAVERIGIDIEYLQHLEKCIYQEAGP